MDYSKITAHVRIENGELEIIWLKNKETFIVNEHDQLFILREIVNLEMKGFEKKFQKQFLNEDHI